MREANLQHRLVKKGNAAVAQSGKDSLKILQPAVEHLPVLQPAAELCCRGFQASLFVGKQVLKLQNALVCQEAHACMHHTPSVPKYKSLYRFHYGLHTEQNE